MNTPDIQSMVENYRQKSSSTISVNTRPIDALCKAYEMGIKDTLLEILKYNNWKPTEDQINAFEHFVRSIGESGYASPYENNTKLLYSLLDQLKKL